MTLPDQAERLKSLNPKSSYIVQAPAGSGKTGILVQRILSLLAHATRPESILAITFTRKASEEMHHRIQKALQLKDYTNEFEHQTYQLAQQALKQHPHLSSDQIHIMTFDALCQKMSNLKNDSCTLHTFPEHLYQDAAEHFLNTPPPNIDTSLKILMHYLDGHHPKILNFMVSLLKQRDQWMPWMMCRSPHQQGQAHAIQTLQAEHANIILDQLTNAQKDDWVDVLHYITPFRALKGIHALANQLKVKGIDQIDLLIFSAEIFLTQSGTWRSKLDARQGFEAASNHRNIEDKARATAHKEKATNLIKNISQNPVIKEHLNIIRLLDLSKMHPEHNSIIEALTACLPHLAAYFSMTLKQHQRHDFLEANLNVIEQLENPETAHQSTLEQAEGIEHILIDEAQDTSLTQYRLLCALTQSWGNCGRTLFIVGDPMQSIYRFRQAQVSLFESIKKNGVNQIKPTPLQLTSNFRSSKDIVDYSNKVFSKVFPKQVDLSLGAITHHPSKSTRSIHNPIEHHWIEDGTPSEQAQWIAQHLQSKHQNPKPYHCAILLRSRRHSKIIIEALHQAKINHQTEAIEPLNQTQHIIDLIALTQAISDPDNTQQWLAALRAPWFGFTLVELKALRHAPNILEGLNQYANSNNISSKRHLLISKLLTDSIQKLPYQGIDKIIRDLWINLGGEKNLSNPHQMIDVEHYFKRLKELLEHIGWPSISNLDHWMSDLHGTSHTRYNSSEHTCTIMTIHKSKGLEFDHVYLPFLDQPPSPQSEQLLWWHHTLDAHNQPICLLAPCSPIQGKNPITQYLKVLEKQKNFYEAQRLLYVATTRSKQGLHLVGSIQKNAQPEFPKSPLGQIWPTLSSEEQCTQTKPCPNASNQSEALNPFQIKRATILPNKICTLSEWTLPNIQYENIFKWRQTYGELAHAVLEQYAGSIKSTQKLIEYAQHWIEEHNISNTQHSKLIYQIKQLLKSTQRSSILNWILQSHQEARSEYAIHHQGQAMRIDRTFVEDKVRWVIDYKTSPCPKNLSPYCWSNILKKQHQRQLEAYGAYFKERKPDQPIRLGIFNITHSTWIHWKY